MEPEPTQYEAVVAHLKPVQVVQCELQQPINPEIVTGELCHQDLLSAEPLNRTRPPGRYQYSDR